MTIQTKTGFIKIFDSLNDEELLSKYRRTSPGKIGSYQYIALQILCHERGLITFGGEFNRIGETMKIGKQIKAARKAKEWSQAMLGREIGLSPQAIGQFERNDNLMTIQTLMLLADALEVTTDWLLGQRYPMNQWISEKS